MLHKAYPGLDYSPRKAQKMPDLRIFTIMDVDMDFRSLGSYKSRDMFKGSPFYDKITPIFNEPNMDAVMDSIGLGSVQVKKTRSYARMVDAITDPLDLMRRLEGCESTNMDQFIRYCLSVSPPYQNRI